MISFFIFCLRLNFVGISPVILFFVSVVISLPFAVGPDTELLASIGGSILWISGLLASLLGFDRFFKDDFEDGTLDQYFLGEHPLSAIVFTKSLTHWLVTGLPVTLLSPIFGLVLTMDSSSIMATFLTLLVGTPALSFIGALGAALTVSLRHRGLLSSVLVLPFCLPVLIFGVDSIRHAGTDNFYSPFLLLSSLTLFFCVLGSISSAYVLRWSLD